MRWPIFFKHHLVCCRGLMLNIRKFIKKYCLISFTRYTRGLKKDLNKYTSSLRYFIRTRPYGCTVFSVAVHDFLRHPVFVVCVCACPYIVFRLVQTHRRFIYTSTAAVFLSVFFLLLTPYNIRSSFLSPRNIHTFQRFLTFCLPPPPRPTDVPSPFLRQQLAQRRRRRPLAVPLYIL